jgi:hypothetical protein
MLTFAAMHMATLQIRSEITDKNFGSLFPIFGGRVQAKQLI